MDRLGSVRRSGRDYFPYGQEAPSTTTGGKEKYGTYRHDGETDLSYADQRYYATGAGRFMTADPYKASAGASEPGSWNRYAYVQNDPINHWDPDGLETYQIGDNLFQTCTTVGEQRVCHDWSPSQIQSQGPQYLSFGQVQAWYQGVKDKAESDRLQCRTARENTRNQRRAQVAQQFGVSEGGMSVMNELVNETYSNLSILNTAGAIVTVGMVATGVGLYVRGGAAALEAGLVKILGAGASGLATSLATFIVTQTSQLENKFNREFNREDGNRIFEQLFRNESTYRQGVDQCDDDARATVHRFESVVLRIRP